MADPISTALTYLSNLVSFKAPLRLLIISCAIICSWVFVEPELKPFKIPNELSITLITIIGFSIGALLSSILFSLFEFIMSAIRTRRKKQQEALKKLKLDEARIKHQVEMVELFKKSFDSYSYDAKKILLSLKKAGTTIRIHETTVSDLNKAFVGLCDNEIIIRRHKIDKTSFFCEINPIYKECIDSLFDFKHHSDIEELFTSEPKGLMTLLKKFQDNQKPEDYVFNISSVTYNNRYNYSPVILFESFAEGEYIEGCNLNFYINEHYHPLVCEKLNKNVRENVLGRH